MASGPIYDSYYKQLQNTVDRLQTQAENTKHENKRLKAEIERLREACEAILDNRIDLGIAINKCRDALQPKKDVK